MAFATKGLTELSVKTASPGKFSVYNALTAIAICRHFGVDGKEIQRALAEAKVKGRTEMVRVSDAFTLMIDYAHNAMALKSLLETSRCLQSPPSGLSLRSWAATGRNPDAMRWGRSAAGWRI